jgi:large subunit ribosomal protein L9
MLVVLRENIEHLGRIGDVVKVTDGYARNFLLPRGLVSAADEHNVALIEHHKKTLEKKRLAQKAVSQEVAAKLNEFSCTLKRKVGENDKLYGSVTSQDVADALKQAGFPVEKRQIEIEGHIKTLGVHPVTVRLEPEVTATVKVWVAKED